MIITKATNAVEVKKDNHVDPYVNWGYLSIEIDNNVYRIIFELNKAYGLTYVRQWSINGNTKTDVQCKYPELGLLSFDCTNGLLGEREFEFSIAYEYLFKPIGIPLSFIEGRKHNWSMGKNEFLSILDNLDIKYNVLYNTIY